jgi:hypothetical protein
VLFLLGGGFAGIASATAALQTLASARYMCILFAIIYGFVAFSGLMLVYDSRYTKLQKIALAIQIPYVTSPYVMYKFFAGARLLFLVNLGHGIKQTSINLAGLPSIGAAVGIGGIEERPWSIGVNVIAIILFLLLSYAARAKTVDDKLGRDDADTLPNLLTLKAWVRLILVAFMVGGGFLGLVVTIDEFSQLAEKGPLGLVVFSIMMILVLFEIFAGLLLTHSPDHTMLVRLAIQLQIPWITSPIVSFRFMCGAGIWLVVSAGSLADAGRLAGENVRWRGQFGIHESLGIGEDLPWSLGVNFIALILLFLIPPVTKSQRSISSRKNIEEPTFWDTLPKPPPS